MNDALRTKLASLFGDAATTAKNCGTGGGGFKPGNSCGRHGGSGGAASGASGDGSSGKPPAPTRPAAPAFRLGGSPGGKDSYKDRIEGTQKEADLEVKKCDKAVKILEAKLKAATARATSPMTAIRKLVEAHDSVKARKEIFAQALKESQAKIAALKAQLKKKAPSQTSLIKAIDGELDRMEIGIRGLKQVTALTEKLIKKADSL